MFAARSSSYDQSARGPDPGARRSSHGRGVRAGLAAILALTVIAIAAPAAAAQSPGSWPCNAYGYLFQARPVDPPTTPPTYINEIYQVDLARGGQPTKVADTEHPINAVAFNHLDGFFYGIQNNEDDPVNPTVSMVRVHLDGSVDDLGLPTGPGGSVGAGFGSAIGEIDPNGHYWLWDSGNGRWYEFDVSSSTPSLLAQGPLTNTVGYNASADWTYSNGSLYSHGIRPTDNQAFLLRFDLSNPAAGFQPVGPIAIPSGPTDGQSGAAFADASGYVYFSQNLTGNIWRVDPVTRQTIRAAQGEPTSGNDGARCITAVIPTITVTKTVNGRVRPADQFTVGLVEDTGRALDSATTTGSNTTASTTNWPVSQGHTYTITDAMATGSPTPLGEYTKSIRCTDADGNPVAVGGSGPTWTLDVAAPTFYTCNVTNQAAADLRIAKTAAPTPVVPGEDVTWTITVTNNGPSTSIGETVTDDLPDEVTFASASAGCGEANGIVTCAVGELAPGAAKTFTITAQVASSLDNCLRNTGTVSGQFDPDSSNNTSTICTPIEGRSNLSITKTASSATVAAGGQVMYTLVVRNNGPSDDPNVSVSDPLPAGLALVSAAPSQGTCTTTNNVVSCELGALKDRGSAQVLVTANLTASAATCGSGSVTNTARVQGAHEDPNPDNNQASAQICGDPPPDPRFDLSSTKTMVTKGKIYVGQTVTYRIVVANKGPDAAPGAKMTDTLNAPATLVSVETTAGSCTDAIPVTCSLGTIAAGDSVTITMKVKHREASKGQTNAASVTGEGTDLVPGDNIDKITKTVRKVTLKVTKVASSRTVSAGGRVSYTIRVKNTSKGVARNVKTCDRLPSGMAFTSATPKAKKSQGQRCWTAKTLKAGQTKSYKVTVRVASGANGNKVNRASVRSPDVKPAIARRPVRVRGVATPVTG
jgi:uncharacterized repeat protein (TIGR01451 family)